MRKLEYPRWKGMVEEWWKGWRTLTEVKGGKHRCSGCWFEEDTVAGRRLDQVSALPPILFLEGDLRSVVTEKH